MPNLIESLTVFLQGLWGISIEAAPYLLVGFTVAAVLHYFLPAEWMVRLLGGGKVRSTAMAAALGTPLPLCSCSVVPTALAIRKKGAPRGATLAFFISTPETGVDSILITYGLLGPVLAVARPLAAILSAFGAGLLLESLPEGRTSGYDPKAKPDCCEHDIKDPKRLRSESDPRNSWILLPQWLRGLSKSFFMLFDEIAIWIAIGLVLSALVGAFLPEQLFASSYGEGWRGMALAIVIGLPIYVCATASTPLAAVMVGKGFSIGAALVFLLVGPATNIGTVTIVWKMLGRWAVFSYLVSIVGVSLVFGVAVDTFFPELGEGLVGLGTVHHDQEASISASFALFLWFLLIWRSGQGFLRREAKKVES